MRDVSQEPGQRRLLGTDQRSWPVLLADVGTESRVRHERQTRGRKDRS